jgi:hypothetical protein
MFPASVVICFDAGTTQHSKKILLIAAVLFDTVNTFSGRNQ